ncbi:MAG: YmdB family metallophosphoesterase [Treponema sp.]|jgi:calcineurin-like phosphoesterase|nr:YmdB family metallophosphoesterase [Treponema sp.]
MSVLKVIMIGDIVGEPGLAALEKKLPLLIKEHAADFVVVNGENAAEGFGLTEASYKRILAAGADVVTSGNHIWEKRDFWPFLDTDNRILRPANYPAGSPGRGWVLLEKNRNIAGPAAGEEPVGEEPAGAGNSADAGSSAISWLVVNLQGREFMASTDCPFRCFDTVLETSGAAGGAGETQASPARSGPIVLVDFHAESTREKESLAYYIDGRVSLMAGTHTHVQTADERVLPGGTAYITDLGMTGVANSVIGMDPKICLERVRKQILYRMEVAAEGNDAPATVQGVVAKIDAETGRALAIQRLGNT